MPKIHIRNYGCRIWEITLNGLRAVILENELLRVGVLVDKGTDIFEFLYKPKDIDCMWHSWLGIRDGNAWQITQSSRIGNFLDNYFGGWQDLFPNADENCVYKGAELGVHGEACILPWTYTIIQDEPDQIQVKFSLSTIRMPFQLEKVLTLKTGKSVLYFDAQVKNLGNEEIDFMWGLHPALGKPFLSDQCIITLPPCKVRTDALLGSDFSRLDFDQITSWPKVKGKNGLEIDISEIPGEEIKCNDRAVIYEFAEGWYAVVNPELQMVFAMTWDKEVFPYLLYWQSFSGWQGYPFYGTAYTMSLEPRSSFLFPLTRVIDNQTQIRLKANQSLRTSYCASLSPVQGKINSISPDGELITTQDSN
jgi:hypothetical protein